MVRVAFVGAGSTVFARNLIGDLNAYVTQVDGRPDAVVELSGSIFLAGADATVTFSVGGIAAGTTTIVRSDVRVLCQAGSSPTGNLQAALLSSSIAVGHRD